MKKRTFSLAYKDEVLAKLVGETGHKTLAIWSVDCVERVLPYFETKFPQDKRPQAAIEALQAWIKTGVFRMAVIRKASLDSHAAAREVGEDNPARSAARAAGQAVASAHVPAHAIAAANYCLQAIYRASNPLEADAAADQERKWQVQHLRDLQNKTPTSNDVEGNT
jgi:hypothetical protein